MRLRYLHIPHYGPLVDIAVVFGQEGMLFSPDDPEKRKGAINFVVGVNGTGKSSLLRAIYQTFRALKLNTLPAQPVTLAWDRSSNGRRVTVLLHCPWKPDEPKWFAVLKPIPEDVTEADWNAQVQGQGKRGPFGEPLHYVGDGDPITASLLQAHLPSKVIAYTSGAEILWDNLECPSLHTDDLVDGEGLTADDRPPGWTIEQEWDEEQHTRVADVLERCATKESGAMMTMAEFLASLKPETTRRLIEELAPLLDMRRKMVTNWLLDAEQKPDPNLRVRLNHLRLAVIVYSLLQVAQELKGKNAERQREALREQILDQRACGAPGRDARRVFNELDWFWPTHFSFVYHDVGDDHVAKRQREQLLCLLALADEVTAQPCGRHRVVISLGPSEPVDLQTSLEETLPIEFTSKRLEMMLNQVRSSRTGAEAVMRVFSSNDDLDTMLFEVFDELRAWETSGLLEEITLTIKRLSRKIAADDEPDDVVVTYDQLSDGEQMLLGRVALLFLLRRQNGVLLLLDEPETHFNDVWKREIIDLVDEAILKTTSAQVVVATHTSIALTDVFSSEIVRLTRCDGRIEADSPAFPTFGTDPGRILLHVFCSPDVIGSRAMEFLRDKLRKEWTAENRAQLEQLVNEIGSGWPRAKLTEILMGLDASSDS